ncbi:glutaredoxin 3 [Candidatus Pantoea edessiphila]|uniref:Glutaredoxin n=1 Tax=Candidatus Pantoea edessiphila TaxID=2044610 RepID=A0A2P5SX38_9GAMM|nr:glutaredoxin 3 [Candidatus Pantoea edessiphila]PPI86907.1 glutaredoxin 3 [Candidatus Pantoea edessiphila]
MLKIEIYTKKTCPYCHQAKDFLNKKGVAFQEISIDNSKIKRQEMIERAGSKTVPQIFINDKPIGGYDDLLSLDNQKKLNTFGL